MAKHTPGPWRQNGTQVHGPKMGLLIAGVCFSRMGDNLGFASKTADEASANARLIAAAPDYDVAGRAMVAAIEQWRITGRPNLGAINDALAGLKAAIAKADGAQ